MSLSTRRIVALIAGGAVVIAALGGPALGSSFDRARLRRQHLAHQIARARTQAHATERMLTSRVNRLSRSLGSDPSHQLLISPTERRSQRHQLVLDKRRASERLRTVTRHAHRQIGLLTAERRQVRAWIRRYGVLHTCPVRGPHVVMNNFGVLVRGPGIPAHIHQGNDIMAATWTPIVAPFAGRAVASPNRLGGLAVKVYGGEGFVYNAHLVAYGRLGEVLPGTVIGYVGSTGDAGGPHDHFEWHPNNGPAVDPYPYLSAVC